MLFVTATELNCKKISENFSKVQRFRPASIQMRSMYAIVVGAGDIGTPLIDIATRSGKDAVMIERNAERAEEAADEFDCLVLNDNATTKDAVEDAGGERADALISTTEADATNIMVCLLAQELDIPEIVSIVHNPEHMNIFE